MWDVSAELRGARAFKLQWVERGGPRVTPPTREGFGVRAVERLLASTIEGKVHLDFAAEGLSCVIDAPLTKSLSASR